MRWSKRIWPKQCQKRNIVRFLLWPRCIANEWRWLEWAIIEQMFNLEEDPGFFCRDGSWYDNRWMN